MRSARILPMRAVFALPYRYSNFVKRFLHSLNAQQDPKNLLTKCANVSESFVQFAIVQFAQRKLYFFCAKK